MKKPLLWMSSLVFLGGMSFVFLMYRGSIVGDFRILADSPTYVLWAGISLLLIWPERLLARRFPRLLGWSWPKAVGWKHNLNTFFMAIPALRLPGFILYFINLPVIVTIEEVIFRSGTHSWPEAILRSAVFGLAHFAVGVPVIALCHITVVGMVLSAFYFRGGLEAAILMHLAIDVLILGSVILVLLLDTTVGRRIVSESRRNALIKVFIGER